VPHLLPVGRRRQAMPSWTEVLGDGPIGGEEPLRVSWRLESLHAPLPLTGGLVGILRTVVEVAVLAMFDAGQEFPLRGTVALELIGHDDPRDVLAPFEELAEELLRGFLVPPALHQDIEDMTVLIDGPPQIVPLTTDREKDLIQMPLVTLLRAPAPELIGILLAEFATPFPDGFVRDDHAADEQEFFHIAVTEAKPVVQPDAMADNLGWKTVMLVAVGSCWCVHATSMAHEAGAVQAAQQVDNA
jgi:hypothetical protein